VSIVTTEPSSEAVDYLKEHRLCVFATGRKDGSPQQSLIGYQFDGAQFLLGGQATSAKITNLKRQTRCSLAVIDGRRVVLVYGQAELVEDAAAMEKLQQRFGPRTPPSRPQGAPAGATPPPRPTGPRVNILFTPHKYITERMNG
jgi:nitroimidazol reductase NimA-like FMN-containing flavoprotein (pyridoxamine 5'-phosphate oxidase superfamily)